MSISPMLTSELALPAPVLLVEDEPLVCRRLEGLLLQLGYQPDALIFASSLAEARACLAGQPVALALVDLGLPVGSGVEPANPFGDKDIVGKASLVCGSLAGRCRKGKVCNAKYFDDHEYG